MSILGPAEASEPQPPEKSRPALPGMRATPRVRPSSPQGASVKARRIVQPGVTSRAARAQEPWAWRARAAGTVVTRACGRGGGGAEAGSPTRVYFWVESPLGKRGTSAFDSSLYICVAQGNESQSHLVRRVPRALCAWEIRADSIRDCQVRGNGCQVYLGPHSPEFTVRL